MKEPAAGGVNWDAYSHEELYKMLWEDADVADVSMIATEWSRHRAALDTHAEVLREQRTALLDSWQGAAAEEAANRLDALAARVEKISELANAGQQAAQEAADALAMARAMMPPPPSNPTAAFTDGPMNWAQSFAGAAGSAGQSFAPAPTALNYAGMFTPAPTSASAFSTAPFTSPTTTPNYAEIFAPATSPAAASDSATSAPLAPAASGSSATPNYAEMFTPTTTPTTTPSSSGMGASFGAVGSAGYSFYFGAATTDAQKAQAVRAMQTYESSLRGSGQLVDDARGAIPPAAQTAAATRAAVTAPGPGGGVPWSSLVGAGPGRMVGVGVGGGTGSVIGSPGAGRGTPLGMGARFGAMPGMAGPGMSAGHLAAESAAARAASHGGMVPPAAGHRSAEDEKHENQLPTIDHGLFVVEVPTSPPVIGDPTGVLR